VAVSLSAPLLIGPGEYWFNLTPACTNGTEDGSCSVGRILLSNTTNRATNVHGGTRVVGEMLVKSSYFRPTYATGAIQAADSTAINALLRPRDIGSLVK
jgi:hypothetical protein